MAVRYKDRGNKDERYKVYRGALHGGESEADGGGVVGLLSASEEVE